MTTPRYQRQDYVDTTIDQVNHITHPICQLKYDGIWCMADVDLTSTRYYSRHGSLKREDQRGGYYGSFVGELMFGSEWCKEYHEREGLFYVFDLIEDHQADLKNTPYIERYARLVRILEAGLLPPNFQLVSNYSTLADSMAMWQSLVKPGHYEGLVFRHPQSVWDCVVPRAKFTFTRDLYIVDFEEGKTGRNIGRLGSFICTESPLGIGTRHTIGGGIPDKLRIDVWENPDRYRGKCITVEARKQFESGLLRHANFIGFHKEK